MDNDLNTSMAVTVLYDVLKAKTNRATKRYVLADFDRVLSLDLLENAARKKAEQKQNRSGLRRVPDRQREARRTLRWRLCCRPATTPRRPRTSPRRTASGTI